MDEENLYDYVVETGTINPQTQTIQAEVQQEYLQAFGQNLDLSPNSPEGVLITAEVLARQSVIDNNSALANQINPNIAGGIYLDAIMALMGLQRLPDTFTQVTCTLTGVAGTVVPQFSLAQDTSGNMYESNAQATIGSDGSIAGVTFSATVAGAISCPEGTLTGVVSQVLGWETITNPTAQDSTGTLTQSDAGARNLRQQSLGLQGDALPAAIIGTLLTTPGVTSVTFLENISSSTQTISGITMVPHSIYACVQGGDDTAVAEVLLNKKSGGCAYNNGLGVNKSVTLTVPYSGQSMTVLFDRPNPITILVNITVKVASSVQEPVQAVTNAILNYVMGGIPGENGLIAGQNVSPWELGGAVTSANPGIYIQDLQIAYAGMSPSFGYTELAITVYQIAVIEAGDINVTVNVV